MPLLSSAFCGWAHSHLLRSFLWAFCLANFSSSAGSMWILVIKPSVFDTNLCSSEEVKNNAKGNTRYERWCVSRSLHGLIRRRRNSLSIKWKLQCFAFASFCTSCKLNVSVGVSRAFSLDAGKSAQHEAKEDEEKRSLTANFSVLFFNWFSWNDNRRFLVAFMLAVVVISFHIKIRETSAITRKKRKAWLVMSQALLAYSKRRVINSRRFAHLRKEVEVGGLKLQDVRRSMRDVRATNVCTW